jgi:Na+-driven multidrug efflux pump
MLVGFWIMLRGSHGVRIRPREMVPDLSYVPKIVRIGAPASVEVTGRALSVNALLIIVGLFSTSVVAGYGVGVRIFSVVFLPAIAVARGVETMTGQNVGAGEPDRAAAANDYAAGRMFVVLSALAVVVFLFAEPIVGVFSPNDRVVDVGATFLKYVAPTFGCIGIMRAYTGGFRGAGETLTSAAISVLMLWVVRLPAAYLLAVRMDYGPEGIWTAFVLSNVVGAAIALVWFRRGTWRTGSVTRGTAATAGD